MIEIDDKLSKVIRASWFTIEEGTYAYIKVKYVREPEKHLLVTRDKEEITVVTDISNLKELEPYERNPENWVLLNIKCGNPFYCAGFLAAVSSEFARNDIDITITSTYTRDYVMVQEENLEKSITILKKIGFTHK